jgi:hypothetical protein
MFDAVVGHRFPDDAGYSALGPVSVIEAVPQ